MRDAFDKMMQKESNGMVSVEGLSDSMNKGGL